MKKFIKNKYKQYQLYKKILKDPIEAKTLKDPIEAEDLEPSTQNKYELLKQKIDKKAESIADENLAIEKKVEEIIKSDKSNIQGLQLRQRLEELVAWINSEFDELETANTQYVISGGGITNGKKNITYRNQLAIAGYRETYYLNEKHNLHPDSKFETIQIKVEARRYGSEKITVSAFASLLNNPSHRNPFIFSHTCDGIHLDEVFTYLENYFVNLIANIKVNENKSN